jgi:hypothetical protein
MTHADGLVTMEIVDCKPEDSGKYRCVATNIHGSDETSCVVIVEGMFEKFGTFDFPAFHVWLHFNLCIMSE